VSVCYVHILTRVHTRDDTLYILYDTLYILYSMLYFFLVLILRNRDLHNLHV